MRLNSPTKVCKICFKEIEDKTLFNVTHKDADVCNCCFQEIKMRFFKFQVLGYNAISIYRYDDKVQSLLYQFKGCFDYELLNVFFERFSRELSVRYRGYVMVPVPHPPRPSTDDREAPLATHRGEGQEPRPCPLAQSRV